ncbi:hypothetical protein HAZT_HAZT005525 [Hyalella azteca]|uniref:Band 3 cytoplasmic domain-containing protein n=1 Tax=Hyalella azteca TaxID=294128 RepID=A0A6A0HDP3_HYAAZ|nr:hypothetical protein HAZT_HAZT005525 [Hyalella azteca]
MRVLDMVTCTVKLERCSHVCCVAVEVVRCSDVCCVAVEDPSTRVQFILGEEQDDGSSHAVHPIFSEMETLVTMDAAGWVVESSDRWWCYISFRPDGCSRWVKFEEDVEEGGERWSKPHVATLSLHALFELRSFLMKGVVLLDMDAISIEQVAELAIEALVNKKQLEPENKELVSINN